jgi:hypothetical protein
VLVADQVRAAADAGAVAVVVSGADSRATAGVIAGPGVTIPAIGVSGSEGDGLRQAIGDSGVSVELSDSTGDNAAYGTVAGFSSRGPRHDGIGRPDVLAAGVGVLTTGAGRDASHHERYTRVSGTSIAAAQVAGKVARVRLANPAWTPATVRAAVIGSAQPLGSDGDRPPVEAQGAGVIDNDDAAVLTTIAAGGRLDFGVVQPGQHVSRPLTFTSGAGTARPLPTLKLERTGDPASGPSLNLVDGNVVVTAADDTPSGVYGGWIIDDEHGLRVPWLAVVRTAEQIKVPIKASLDTDTFAPARAGTFAARLSIDVGGDPGDNGSLGLTGAQVLDVRLRDADGKDLGAIATMRGVLPGVYEFGVTGRDSAGAQLSPGSYTLRVRTTSAATPTAKLTKSADVTFTIS